MNRNGIIIILLAIVFPPLAFILSLCCLARSAKCWKEHIFVISLFFAVMSYSYVPLDETDLSRYFDYIDNFVFLSFWDGVMHIYEGQPGLYIFNAVAWIAAHSHDYHLLPAVSTFFVYYIGLYITFVIFQNEKISYRFLRIYLLLLVCFIDWYAIANNVRNILAFSLVGLAVFRDVYQRKRGLYTLLLYILPITIHPTSIILILLRAVVKITQKSRCLLLILAAFIGPFVELLYFTIPYYTSNVFVNFLMIKSYNYFFDRGTDWGIEVSNSAYFGVHKFLYISLMAAFCILALQYNTIQKTKRENLLNYQQFVFLLSLMAISCFPMLRPEYWRFTAVAFVCSSALLLMSMQKPLKSVWEKVSLTYIMGLAPICLCLWLYRLQYFNISDWIYSILTTSPVVCLIKDIYLI